jgi:hypothetical protein
MMNLTLNSDCGGILYSIFKFKFWILRVAVVSLLIGSVLIGNTLILISIVKYRRHYRGFLYQLIGHLAVADIVLSIGLLIHMFEYASTYIRTNNIFCVIKIFCVTTSVICSSKLLLLMSIDRFRAIVSPLKHYVNSSKHLKRRIVLVFIWIASVGISCFKAVEIYNFAENSATFTCLYADLLPSNFSLFTSCFILFQFIISTILCIIAIWKLKTNNMSRLRFNKSIMKYKLLIRINGLYLICWSPYIVTSFLIEIMRNGQDDHNLTYTCSYSVIFGCLPSGTNWIINGVANKKFRDAFMNILNCNKVIGNPQGKAVQSETVTNRQKSYEDTKFCSRVAQLVSFCLLCYFL